MKKTIKHIFLISCFFFIRVNCIAQVQKDTLKVLFVGNSYTYYENMPKMVSVISENTKTKLVTEMSTAGGARLRYHWQDLHGLNTKEMIKKGEFDIVVLQAQSMEALQKPDNLKKYAKLFSHFIKKNGAKPYFYLTWARENTPEKQTEITKVFKEIANSNDAVLVPVGEAWALARKQQPTIKLYDPDGSHPSRLGVYLTSHVFVASFLNEIPKTNKFGKSKDLLFLKEVAKKFLKKE